MGTPRDTPPDAEPEQKETGPPPIRIAILSSPTHPLAGEQVGLILSKYQKEQLERALAQPIKIAFISQSNAKHEEKTHVRYRDPYLRAAIHVAGAIPREQVVEPMNSDERLREQVDLFIYVGERVR